MRLEIGIVGLGSERVMSMSRQCLTNLDLDLNLNAYFDKEVKWEYKVTQSQYAPSSAKPATKDSNPSPSFQEESARISAIWRV